MLRRKRPWSLALLAPLALVSAGCLGYAPPGTVTTPGAPGESTETRLPQLLQQLQGAGAGLELFDATPSSQVLAAQDTNGGKDDPTPSTTASATQSPTTIAQLPGATATPTGGSAPGTTTTPSGTATTTPAPTATATPSPTATATPTPTVPPEETPPPVPPSEGSGAPPPTE